MNYVPKIAGHVADHHRAERGHARATVLPEPEPNNTLFSEVENPPPAIDLHKGLAAADAEPCPPPKTFMLLQSGRSTQRY